MGEVPWGVGGRAPIYAHEHHTLILGFWSGTMWHLHSKALGEFPRTVGKVFLSFHLSSQDSREFS